jgi:hypothetical protein
MTELTQRSLKSRSEEHMLGHGFYNKHSHEQAKANTYGLPLITEAISHIDLAQIAASSESPITVRRRDKIHCCRSNCARANQAPHCEIGRHANSDFRHPHRFADGRLDHVVSNGPVFTRQLPRRPVRCFLFRERHLGLPTDFSTEPDCVRLFDHRRTLAEPQAL